MTTKHPVFKQNAGYTVVEMLATVVVLLLFTGLMVTGVKMAVDAYSTSMTISEAQTLSATLQATVSDELRYATRLTVTTVTDENGNIINKVEGVFSPTYGEGASFTTNESGHVLLCGKKILSDKAYPHGLKANVTIDDYSKNIFTVTVRVYLTPGDYLSEVTFDVKNLNVEQPSD